MHSSLSRLIIALSVIAVTADRSDAVWHRRACCCYCPRSTAVTAPPRTATRELRVRTYLEGSIAEDDDENALMTSKDELRARVPLPFNVSIPADELFEGKHRKIPKTTVVHGGELEVFDNVDELISYFESPQREQEQWWGTIIKKTTNERNEEIELVNVVVKDAWIYEISRQKDNDYHLLIGIRPDRDEGRYANAEISGINPDSPDANSLWRVRKSFKKQYEGFTGKSLTKGYIQPHEPIHIRISGSIFLDADHDRSTVGHGDIKNFTSWEIHPITNIDILGK